MRCPRLHLGCTVEPRALTFHNKIYDHRLTSESSGFRLFSCLVWHFAQFSATTVWQPLYRTEGISQKQRAGNWEKEERNYMLWQQYGGAGALNQRCNANDPLPSLPSNRLSAANTIQTLSGFQLATGRIWLDLAATLLATIEALRSAARKVLLVWCMCVVASWRSLHKFI